MSTTQNQSPEEYELVILGSGTGGTVAAWTFAVKANESRSSSSRYVGELHLQDDINREGYRIEEPVFNKEGEQAGVITKLNPAISKARDVRVEMRQHAMEFGMTPASATKVHAAPPASASKKEVIDFNQFIAGNDEEQDERLA